MNAVAEIETRMTPQQLMQTLLIVERSLGRRRARPGGDLKEPRVIDLDILLFHGGVVDSPDLKIPHPRMAGRKFVLIPLTELVPSILHPVLKKTATELLAESTDSSEVKLFAPAAQQN